MPDPIVGAIERLLNAQLEQSTPARRQAAVLAGRSLGIVLLGPEIELVVTAEPDRLRLVRTTTATATADATVAGTPIALLEALRAGKAGLVGRREIVTTGDVDVLESFSELLVRLAPDVEELLATFAGDIVAHESMRAARAARDWGARALDALAMNTGEYLQEETHTLPARHAIDAFASQVETLRDDVERAAARLERLWAARAAHVAPTDSASGSD